MSSIWDSLFGSGSSYQDPSKAAMPFLQQIPGLITPYYQPFIDTGNQAMSSFFDQIKKLSTPGGATDIYNQLGSGFSTSPGTVNAINNATKQSNQVAAAGGMFGTPTEQAAVGAQTQALTYNDFNQYMQQMMGLYDTGLKGEADLMHQGFGASTELSSDLAKNLMSEAGLSYAGAQGQNMFNAQSSSQFMQMLGALFGMGGSLGAAAIMAP